jgi:hypothetical protein
MLDEKVILLSPACQEALRAQQPRDSIGLSQRTAPRTR